MTKNLRPSTSSSLQAAPDLSAAKRRSLARMTEMPADREYSSAVRLPELCRASEVFSSTLASS